MASEIDIRAAIVERIKAFTAAFDPPPLVEGRDVTGILDAAAINELRDTGKRIHAWIVVQKGMIPSQVRSGGTLYELVYELCQLTQHRSGSDTSNSDREASLERDAVTNAFRSRGEMPAILKHAKVKPIQWPASLLNRPEPTTNGQVRISKAILRAYNFYGPVACS